uniref:PHD finger protein At3g20280 n=1 Tax=Anthurium amnicola TaxID=1678845 RepID=A0A1D1Z037_9ARAE
MPSVWPSCWMSGEVAGRLPSLGPAMGEDSATAAEPALEGRGTATASKKRPRFDSEPADLGRVAEIVMVLSAMGQMRAGRDPTAAEKALMTEAREKLAKICESVELRRRKELFTKEMAMAVVVDHGLNPPKENIPRPPKLSIAEKLANTRRKMEEAKEIASQSSPHPSQLLHVSFGVKSDGRTPLYQGAQRFLPDKASSMPSGGSQTVSSGVHVPALASATSSLKQSQLIEAQHCLSPLKSSSTPSASCSGNRLPEKTLTPPMQATPVTAVNSVPANRVQHTAVKVESGHGINFFQPSAQLVREHDPKAYAIQTTPGGQQFIHQLPHTENLHDPSVANSHNEISKMVQRILPPKACDQPNWTPPATDYINKPLNCQMCKIIINDVESLLVCDACEKGMHMKCLLSYNQRIIPKAEWHCPRCLSSSNGRPLPPKYGRVTRGFSTSRSSPSTGSVQVPSEKVETVDMKLNSYQKMISNGHPVIQTRSHTSTGGNGCTDSTVVKMMPNTREKQVLDCPVTNRNMDNDINKGTTADHLDGSADPTTTSSGSPDGSPNLHNLNTGLLPCQMQQQASDCSLQTKVDSKCNDPSQISETTIDVKPIFQAPNDSQIVNEVDVLIKSNVSCNHSDNKLKDLSDLKKTAVHGGDCDNGRENMVASQETAVETLDRDCGPPVSAHTDNAEWVGDAVRTVEERSYYQSCCTNGVIYELQDHVLISSHDDNLFPSKLQALWEDKSGTKWATILHFYYPSDLSEIVPRPAIPENDEVYESNNASTVLVESIRRPCQVLPLNQFKKESERRSHSEEASFSLNSVFLCRWSYDESKGVFQSLPH